MAALAGSWPDSRRWLSDGVERGSILFFFVLLLFLFLVFDEMSLSYVED
jgi:hypothetical protein